MTEFSEREPNPGEEYLAHVTQLHEAGDGVMYGYSALDTFIEEKEREARTADLGVVSFLADFARDRREREQRKERWESGQGLPVPTEEVRELITAKTPRHVVVNAEALGGIQLRPTRHYKIDMVTDDIMAEVADLLPRKIDAYHYKQGYAHDVVEVPGLGEVEVKLHDSNDIFKSISEVRIGDFRIRNCRDTGLWYNGNLIDISHPSDIELADAERTEIQLYSDESGIFVRKDGKRFTNERVSSRHGRGYRSDSERDELLRTYNGCNDMAPVREGEAPNEGWRDDTTEYSWKQIQDEAIVWMANNVLFPLRRADRPQEQATELPEDEPYPFEKVGPIFTFIETKDIDRVVRIKDHPESAYPDERHAIHPSKRLVPLGSGTKDLPSEVYDGYIYCKPGVIADMNPEDVHEIGNEYRRTDNLFGGAHGFAQVRPKHARDIYVVDWAEWQKFREATFSDTHDRLTDDEMSENYAVVARTLTPVTEYDGSFQEPVVLVGRNLELDEVELLVPAPERQRR
jgi:hypothetical protein